MQIEVVLGDITYQKDIEAVLWLLHTGGQDYNGMADITLKRIEPAFHQKLIEAHGRGEFRQNKDTVVVTVPNSRTGYDKAVFVGDEIWIDDPLPLGEVIRAGLTRADNEGITSLALFPFRTGRAAWMFDVNEQERDLIAALKSFSAQNIQKVRVVVYADREQALRLRQLVG